MNEPVLIHPIGDFGKEVISQLSEEIKQHIRLNNVHSTDASCSIIIGRLSKMEDCANILQLAELCDITFALIAVPFTGDIQKQKTDAFIELLKCYCPVIAVSELYAEAGRAFNQVLPLLIKSIISEDKSSIFVCDLKAILSKQSVGTICVMESGSEMRMRLLYDIHPTRTSGAIIFTDVAPGTDKKEVLQKVENVVNRLPSNANIIWDTKTNENISGIGATALLVEKYYKRPAQLQMYHYEELKEKFEFLHERIKWQTQNGPQ